MSFNYNDFVAAARVAACAESPNKAVKKLLATTLADPELMASGLPHHDEDEILLFEDETVSIWSCRFDPNFVMPPHEHKMDVHIGVVSGHEKNIMFQRDKGKLCHIKTEIVKPGEILSIGPDGLHAVSASGKDHSHALHVYLGPLTKVKRDLFDWTTGAVVYFKMDNFNAMKRAPNELPDY
jgi:predicted metal-dependent enzyme (double-stranded beta helix superfamily)